MKKPSSASCCGKCAKNATHEYRQQKNQEVEKALEAVILLRRDMLRKVMRFKRGNTPRMKEKADLLEHNRLILKKYLTLLSQGAILPEIAMDLVKRWRKQYFNE
jgi:hypothetical protein